MPTVATFTRISRFEIPYLRAFIEFYFDFHKVNRMIFIVFPHEDLAEIRRYLRFQIGDRIDRVQFLRGRGKIWLDRCTPIVKRHATEDYVMFVDADEYLFLNGQRLGEYVNRLSSFPTGRAIRYFSWILCRNDSMNRQSSNSKEGNRFKKGMWQSQTKYLVKSTEIKKLHEHHCETHHFPFGFHHQKRFLRDLARFAIKKVCAAKRQCVVHFSLRSFEEALLKSVQRELFQTRQINSQHLQSTKEEIARDFAESLSNGDLPKQLIALAQFKRQVKTVDVPIDFEKLVPIDRNYESKLLSDLHFTDELVDRFHDAYIAYLNSL